MKLLRHFIFLFHTAVNLVRQWDMQLPEILEAFVFSTRSEDDIAKNKIGNKGMEKREFPVSNPGIAYRNP